MNFAQRPPMGLKAGKAKPNKAHLALVAALPCVCCGSWPVEVHHCICGRYGQRRASDEQTIPLCVNHHRGPDGIHTRRAWWVETFGQDTDYLPIVADALAGELNSVWSNR